MAAVEEKRAADDAGSEYDSEDDADFQDDDGISNSSSDESDVPMRRKGKAEKPDSGDEATVNKRKKKRKDTEGKDDLILTRSQKRSKSFYS